MDGFSGAAVEVLEVLADAAKPLVAPARGRLAAPENRELHDAVTALAEVRATGHDWHILLTADRAGFGGLRSAAAQEVGICWS